MTVRNSIRRMSEAKLEKELAFARGFAPPAGEHETAWLAELEEEAQRRSDAPITAVATPRSDLTPRFNLEDTPPL